MAIVSAENMNLQAHGYGSLSPVRQAGVMIGLALSIALGVTVAMWSQTPNYVMLHGELSPRDMSQVTSLLSQSNIDYRIEGMGMVLVPADRMQEARMKLAAQGFSGGDGNGYELLDKEQGLGSSRFLQKARLHRAMEGELARSIGRLSFVEGARVHLAIPKQSAFARKNSTPTASVVLSLRAGRVLDDNQIAGIVNMVASAVPELDDDNVSVIDQKGRLLNNPQRDSAMMLSSTQFEYTRKLEETYTQRIIDIISPITGLEGVRAQVVAKLDFTSQEETRETYAPDQKVVRSEQLYEQITADAGIQGVPGALTNQPPAAGALTPQDDNGATDNSRKNLSRAVRNYEIDRTISHVKQNPVTLEKLSVAVVVDYKTAFGEDGKPSKQAMTDDEIAYITSLVKETVGLDEERGDTLNVVNTSFMQPAEVEPMPEPPIWEQAWVWDIAKQAIGAIAVLFLAFGILKPMLANMANNTRLANELALAQQAAEQASVPQQSSQAMMAGPDGSLGLPGPDANAQQMQDMATTMAKDDPARVAQVMNNWVASDG